MEVKVLENIDQIAEEIASSLIRLSNKYKREPIHIALSGGNTPKIIFKYLTKKYGTQLAKSNFHFWWGDDRCVPPTDDDSNYKWAYQLWLEPIGIKDENIHRVIGENNPEDEAIRYSNEIEKLVAKKNTLPQFHYVLLGLGEDGHTASIFPHQIELLKTQQYCAVAKHPTSGQNRITFTGNVINNAEEVVFLSTGSKKSEIIHEIIDLKSTQYPATHIHPHSNNLTWLIDTAASEKLTTLNK